MARRGSVRVHARIAVLALVVALIGALGVPVATAADKPVVTGPGTGPQPKGLGLGSAAALAQKTCTANGHTSLNFEGGGPFCVNPWPAGKSNGGATAPGVTAKEVKIVAYVPNDQMLAAGTASDKPKNQATGQTATVADSIKDFQTVYDYADENFGTYQLWGRTPKFEIVTASGTDETAQRADALEVINMKPFMVVDLTATGTGGAPVFASTIAARKILSVSASTTATIGGQQSPYRWNYGADNDAGSPLTAAFVGKSLAGRKAQWAGDKDLASQTRKFGLVYPTTGFDLAEFQRLLKQSGGPTVTAAVSYDPTDAQVADQAPTFMSKLKAAGVTSVITFADNSLMAPITKAATAQQYSPEWVFTGYAYQDLDLFARNYDQDQMKHAFGLSVLFPSFNTIPDYLDVFKWYWGKTQGNNWGISSGLLQFAYQALQYAGPTLTADNVKKGLFSVPATGGAATGTVVFQSGYGNTVGMPYPEYSLLGTDRALAFWNGEITVPTQAINIPGKGGFVYMNGSKRYNYKGFSKAEPKFFDDKGAVTQLTAESQFPGGVLAPASPCTDCPSNGGTG